MTELDPNDDTTWEDFFGTTTTDLMPSIMGAFDVFIENTRSTTPSSQQMDGESRSSSSSRTPKKTFQAGNFSNLSPCVQKILSNVPDEELTKHFASEEILSGPKRTGNRPTYRSLRSPDRRNSIIRTTTTRLSPEKQHLHPSCESLNIISPNVQKMLSNFPDAELILGPAGDLKNNRNHSFLHHAKNEVLLSKYTNGNADLNDNNNDDDGRDNRKSGEHDRRLSASVETDTTCDAAAAAEENNKSGDDDGDGGCSSYSPKPLGSYLHTSPHGIASRTPIGRKNVGKFLQVPSECSVGTTSSTASSEVSRPVSLTSLGSCSSSSSSGPNQPCSAYLASAESLDSDPESNDRQGSADSGIAEQVMTVSTQQRVLQEVLETETVYVSDLNEVIQGYLEPWRRDEHCPLAQHISTLFSNIVEIHSFNKSFLEQLQEADFDPTKTANVFIQNVHGFTVYNEYCTNYPRTMEILGELTRDDNMISVFRVKQMALGHALPLGSYLLKPVQRILKYHLLLQRLSKQCEPAHKPAVDLALTTMTSIATSINNMKRKHEHTVRVHEIQSLLCDWPGPDLTTQGELIAEGTFRMNGARGRRHVVLFDKILLIAKKKQDGSMVYKLHIKCSNLMLVEQVRKEPLSFQILPFDNPRLQCTLRARSPQHKREWTLMIKRAILENYNAVIPNHARQLVMQLGQDVHETEEDSNDKWLTLNKQSTPHYLERRSRTRKSRTLANKRGGDQSFPSLGSWRRKSEPAMAMIHQYNTKTVPKKISKLKKAKEGGANATFYTDLSDSENCDAIGESNESLSKSVDIPDNGNSHKAVEKNLEKIVSDLLMQNGEFHKVLNRPRKSRVSEPEASVWLENRVRMQEVTKADSLPRSFQLNDQVRDCDKDQREDSVLDESLKEDCLEDGQYENDLSSQLDDNEYPVHKIYRKTAIRFSLVQRIRALVSEEHRGTHKYPAVHKQGSEAMGEKIAHPDYVDPHKLFSSSSRSSLAWEDTEEPKRPDMTINEKDVLKEFEERLSMNNNTLKSTSQNFLHNGSSHNKLDEEEETTTTTTVTVSSQNSDSYYESVLDTKLVEEYTKDENGKLVVKQDSFRNSESVCIQKYRKSESDKVPERRNLKRPTKAPPPIPVKPTHLLNNNKLNDNKTINGNTTNQNQESIINNNNNERGTSWVKAMVGRFE